MIFKNDYAKERKMGFANSTKEQRINNWMSVVQNMVESEEREINRSIMLNPDIEFLSKDELLDIVKQFRAESTKQRERFQSVVKPINTFLDKLSKEYDTMRIYANQLEEYAKTL